MFIQTETTPNPLTMKFIPDTTVNPGEPVAIANQEEAVTRSPLAASLFTINGVDTVFLGADFISVTRTEDFAWDLLKPAVLTAIMEHFTSGKPVLEQAANTNDDDSTESDPLSQQIKELIDTRIRPSVAMDGGDIIFHSFDDGVVKLELLGACSGCPSASITLKEGIENMLKHYIPEVESVEAVM